MPTIESKVEKTICIAGLLFAALALPWPMAAQVDQGWQPIDPADLKLKDNPKEPGGPAMVLDVWDDFDNPHSSESIRVRIKIFREEGQKYANVEIPYLEKFLQVEDLRARTVSPEGQSTPFSGAVYDKDVIKAKGYKLHAKTLTFPNVQNGSVLEYAYRLHWKGGFPDLIQHPWQYMFTQPIAYPAADWQVQRDIFVRRAVLTLHPFKGGSFQYNFVGFKKNPEVETRNDGSLQLRIEDIPGYTEEEATPPEASLRNQVRIYYTFGFFDPQAYWRAKAKLEGDGYANFLKKSALARKEVERLIAQGDTDEQKIRKLYARAQQIRMISFEESKTEKEMKRQDLKENRTVDDVLQRNYAYANEVNLVFLALVQAAGFKAYPVRVASRRGQMFQLHMYDTSQMNAMVVELIVSGKPRFFDPATLYCPFDLIPWEETDTVGLQADSLSPALVEIPARPSTEAVTRRKGTLRLDESGNVEGDIQVIFEGQEALTRRIEAHNQDQQQRIKDLEEWMRAALPQNSEIKLVTSDGWDKNEGNLTATFHVQSHEYANSAGQRVLFPLGYFQSSGKSSLFGNAKRNHPVYFRYSAETYDDVVLTIPDSLAVEAVPSPQIVDRGVAKFSLKAARDAKSIQITQSFVLGGYYFPAETYAPLKNFYQTVRSAGDQAVVLKKAGGPVPAASQRQP